MTEQNTYAPQYLDSCPFCELSRTYLNLPRLVYDNDRFFSLLDAFPVTPGHTLVVPKRHFKSPFDFSTYDWQALNTALIDTRDCIEFLISNAELRRKYDAMHAAPMNEQQQRWIARVLCSRDTDTRPDGYNIGVNIGETAGQTVMHAHFHIIPRHKGDVAIPAGGVRSVIPGLGDHNR